MNVRPRRDLDDLDENLFDRDEAQRLRAERAQQAENHRKFEAEQAEQAARRAAGFKEWSRRAGVESIRAGYEALGVEPPSLDGNGEPVCSVDLLMRIGWRIENTPDGKVWIRPPAHEPWTGPKDKDSLPKRKDRR